ncbi:hypothetical protein MNBD_GAMMA01-112 [hydrothermal vent metagenome]|uniref:AsmA domain-containing protein n=1 Tax=hydrothermal vent metagenome TaxID=652676 RepID=A0A3B0W2G2_9ZZZZ
MSRFFNDRCVILALLYKDDSVMKKLFKWMVGILISLVVLVVIAAVVLPLVLDPNDHKDRIEGEIQQQIGRQAQLNGEIQWSVFPWLALTFNDVDIKNATGFKGDNLAKIQTLSARVKLLPLLKQNVEIGRVVIDTAEFTLQVNKQGHSNWQSILDNLNSGNDTKQESGSPSDKFSIAGISLNNITLNYFDSQAGMTLNISKLELTTSEIAINSLVTIATSMQILMPDSGLNINLTSDIIAKNLLSDEGIEFSINNFKVAGQLSSDSPIPLDINATQVGVINLAKDTLLFPKVIITAGDAQITSDISGSNISQNMSLSGSYSLASFNLNKFMASLLGSPLVSSDIFADFSSTGKWLLSGNHLKLADLVIKFDKTVINGSTDIKDLDNLRGKFGLNINQLNIDDFVGDEDSSASGSNNPANSEINFGNLTGSINIDSLTASGTKIDNVKMQVKTNGAKMVLEPVTADFYQGMLVTAVRVNTKAKSNKIIVEHKMNKIQAGPLLTDLAGSELLTGIGNLDINLNIDEPFSEIPLKTAHGQINYTLADGAIYGVDVFGMMQTGLSMLYPELKQEEDDGIKKTSFALMQLDADINAGIITTRVLKIESPYLQITGEVTIDLINMSIDGTIEPVLLDIPDQLVSDKYTKLLNIPIPVAVSGSLLEPDIKIDAKKLLLATQKERIDKEKDKLKGKLLDSLFGKDKDK